MTASAHDRQVLSAGRPIEPGRTGVLVLRIWLEGGGDDPQLRIRMCQCAKSAGEAADAEDAASASTVEDALAFVGEWLERFRA